LIADTKKISQKGKGEKSLLVKEVVKTGRRGLRQTKKKLIQGGRD